MRTASRSGAERDTAIVDGGHGGDERDAHGLSKRRSDGEEVAEVGGEVDRQPGNGGGDHDEEIGPPAEEGEQRAVRLAQKNVLAAGGGDHRAELGVGECAEKRKHSGEDPNGDDPGRGRQAARHQVRDQEDAGADDGADDDGDRIEEPKFARQLIGGRHEWP
jgi:hypothetical protein